MLFNLLSNLVTRLIHRLIYVIEIMGNSRSTLLLEEENLRQIEEETGCKSKNFEKNIKQVDLDITFLKIYS